MSERIHIILSPSNGPRPVGFQAELQSAQTRMNRMLDTEFKFVIHEDHKAYLAYLRDHVQVETEPSQHEHYDHLAGLHHFCSQPIPIAHMA